MSVAVDKFKYKLPYKGLFGGVSAMTVDQFKIVNGFSNQYWGWGGEDDDMAKRLKRNNLTITRYKPDIARWDLILLGYYMDQSIHKAFAGHFDSETPTGPCHVLNGSFYCFVLRYTMIKHERETANKPNPERHKLLKISNKFQRTDGLVNLK